MIRNGIDQTQIGKTEIHHGTADGTYVERSLRFNKNHTYPIGVH
jgi:hypothetical protein